MLISKLYNNPAIALLFRKHFEQVHERRIKVSQIKQLQHECEVETQSTWNQLRLRRFVDPFHSAFRNLKIRTFDGALATWKRKYHPCSRFLAHQGEVDMHTVKLHRQTKTLREKLMMNRVTQALKKDQCNLRLK